MWFKNYFRKKRENKEREDFLELQRALAKSITSLSSVPLKPKPKLPPETDTDSMSHEFIRDDYVWFKCKSCQKKKKKRLTKESVFHFYNDEGYGSTSVKWCKDCVANAAFKMGVTDDDLLKAERRLILNKLENKKDE